MDLFGFFLDAHLQVERVLVPFELQQPLLDVGQSLERVVGLRPVRELVHNSDSPSYIESEIEVILAITSKAEFTCKIHRNRIPLSPSAGLRKARGPWTPGWPGGGCDGRCGCRRRSCSGRARCRCRYSLRRTRSRYRGCPRRNRHPRRCTTCSDAKGLEPEMRWICSILSEGKSQMHLHVDVHRLVLLSRSPFA